MDYLNYGKQVQHKPQGFNASTGDGLVQLFPIPVLICPYSVDYTKELEWICKQEYKKNTDNKRVQYNRQSEDTFVLDRPELSNVRAFIEAKLNDYVINIMGSDSELVITQSWLNKSGKGESHHEHRHPNSMISGVWYPQIHEKLPPIQFTNIHQREMEFSIKNYNKFNSQNCLFPMKRGELILFPSNLYHSVPVNKSDEERLVYHLIHGVKVILGRKNL